MPEKPSAAFRSRLLRSGPREGECDPLEDVGIYEQACQVGSRTESGVFQASIRHHPYGPAIVRVQGRPPVKVAACTTPCPHTGSGQSSRFRSLCQACSFVSTRSSRRPPASSARGLQQPTHRSRKPRRARPGAHPPPGGRAERTAHCDVAFDHARWPGLFHRLSMRATPLSCN